MQLSTFSSHLIAVLLPQRHLQVTLRLVLPLLQAVSPYHIHHINVAIINSFLANVQTFTGTLGGAAPAVVQGTGARPFTVNGDTFVNQAAALQRSCSVQNTACSNAANSGSLAGTTVGDCNTQEAACNAAAA